MKLNTRFTTFATSALTLAAFVFTFTACNRQKNEEDTGFATDHATLEKTFSDVQSIADEAGTSGSLATFKQSNNTVLGGCATVTHDTVSNPHVLTIDFGTSNCLCQDGNYRRGKIIITYSGHYRDANYAHTITFNNYFVNDNGVTGTKTVTNTGNNTAGQPVYSISINGAINLANNNGTISWTSQRTRTWTAGYTTSAWSDDEYDIAGSGTVTRASGKTFTINITTPLHVALNCRWVESGVVQITPQGAAVRTLDYGNGTCDAQANFTVNGKTYSISLK